MDRMACVDITHFSLQLCLRRASDLQAPWAVVNREEATGEILQANRRAWAAGVRPGMKVAAAMALCGQLRTATVSATEQAQAVLQLMELLHAFSPSVEANSLRPGSFWLDGRGLDRLFGGAQAWATRLALAMEQQGWRAAVIVGFSRFATATLALGASGPAVYDQPADEADALGRVALERLELPLADIQLLTDLGVRTIGQLCAWRRADVQRRIGPRVVAVWDQACQPHALPVQNQIPPPPVEVAHDVDLRQPDTAQLCWWIDEQLPPLMHQLEQRGHSCNGARITLRLDDHTDIDASVRLAQPANQPDMVLKLAQLRLDGLQLRRGIRRITLRLDSEPLRRHQPSLLDTPPRRDLQAASRAMAMIAAEFGTECIGHWERVDGHLPEAQTRFVPDTTVRLPVPAAQRQPLLVRRLLSAPTPLGHRSGHEPDGWLVAGLDAGPVIHHSGPHIVSGGWWAQDVHREYYFTQTRRGDLLWVFHDRRRRSWFKHGEFV
jgi:protein ImuB